MEERILWVTVLLNRIFGKAALALLAALHIKPSNPEYPIPNQVALEIVVFFLAALFFLWLKSRISVDRPGATQQCMEALLTNSMGVGIRDLLEDNVGQEGQKYVVMLGSIGIFVLCCNLLGLLRIIDPEHPAGHFSGPSTFASARADLTKVRSVC